MSTHRSAIALKNARKIVTPITDGKSLRKIDVMAYWARSRLIEDRLGDEGPGKDAGQVEPEHRDRVDGTSGCRPISGWLREGPRY